MYSFYIPAPRGVSFIILVSAFAARYRILLGGCRCQLSSALTLRECWHRPLGPAAEENAITGLRTRGLPSEYRARLGSEHQTVRKSTSPPSKSSSLTSQTILRRLRDTREHSAPAAHSEGFCIFFSISNIFATKRATGTYKIAFES